MEAEIENLSWKIEHAETTDRGDLENQMDIAEKRRQVGYTLMILALTHNFQVQVSEGLPLLRTSLLIVRISHKSPSFQLKI